MQTVGDCLRASGVTTIYLVHGTFVGHDAFGLLRMFGRFFPCIQRKGQELTKKIIDAIAGEAGNYTKEYAQLLERSINRAGEDNTEAKIEVKLFKWSGANHHIARADAAVRLIHEINQNAAEKQTDGNPNRVLIWGHSHGGNAFALLTNLLAQAEGSAGEEVRKKFFHACRSFYRWPLIKRVDMPVWVEVQKLLAKEKRPIDEVKLDIVTFGSPIRYGWDSDGYAKLLHFVNHRPTKKREPHLAPYPPSSKRMQTAEDGDYVQHIGIAGTNFMPGILEWRTLMADVRLNKLLQPGIRARDLPSNLKFGARVPEDGTTLLVDYGPGEGNISNHALGHAVYTRKKWLLFHAEEVARRFYGA